MDTPKHSPGPWKWKDKPDHEEDMPTLLDVNGESVCYFGNSMQYYPWEGTPPEAADATLIAAAPELLDVLWRMEACGVIVGFKFVKEVRELLNRKGSPRTFESLWGIVMTSPGPWKWHEQNGSVMEVLVDGNNRVVCQFGNDGNYDQLAGEAPMPADQALIAAAPEMLALLKRWATDRDGVDGSQNRHSRLLQTQLLYARIAEATK